MSELGFNQFENHARSTAYFLDIPERQAQFDVIYDGFNEELDEILYDKTYPAELTALLWGRQTIAEPARQALLQSKPPEAGDLLYFITGASMLHGTGLHEAAVRGAELYTGQPQADCNSFEAFDNLLSGRMEPAVREDYNPDYFGMQFFNLPPFTSGDFDSFQPDDSVGPLQLNPDGRYSLERLARTFSEQIHHASLERRADVVASAGLLLGGLSMVLQHRFSSSLAKAALNNIAKRERRAANRTLAAGSDAERSRQPDEERPALSGFDNTLMNLVYSAPPAQD